MHARCILYYFFLFLIPVVGNAQVGAPLINVDFGDAEVNPGPPLPTKNTAFDYSAEACPARGKYTITNSLYRCPSTRMGRSIDNTPQSKNGYMMLVNDTVSSKSKILYIDTLKESLCPGTEYRFSAYILNVEIPNYCKSPNFHLPAFTFSIETTTGLVLQSKDTGPIPFGYNLFFTPKFSFYDLAFVMPAGINNLVLKIKDDPYLFTDCGYAFAIDDIQFAATGPKANIAFDSAMQYEWVKTVCFQDNKTISMAGTLGTGFINSAVQWQQSIDNGFRWTDIPGATNFNFSKTFSVADTFLFRMRASESGKIGNPNCSVVSNMVKVIVDGIPDNYSISSNSPVCVGSVLQFNGQGTVNFSWTGPNGYFDDVGYASIYHTTMADSGTYYAKIISYGGCVKEDSLHVEIVGTEDVTISSPQSICKGNTVQLHATGGTNYVWVPAIGLSDPNIADPKATPAETTTYTVKVSNGAGCIDSASVAITILNSIPVKAIISGPKYLCRPSDSASFKDISTGPVSIWKWDFGNGMKSILQNPPVENYFIESNMSDYTIHLIVADTAGCADSTSLKLKVENNCFIAVPTAFTPNGDGLNDYLYPLNAYKATYLTFRVFNRYGQLVFETTDWTKKWDGNREGKPMPADVYVWQLNYTDAWNKRISLKGSTLLIR